MTMRPWREQPYEWPEHTMTVDEHQVVWVRWGTWQPHVPPVVLLSAAGRPLSTWKHLVSQDPTSGAEMYALDLPGSGRSPATGCGLPLYEELITRFLERVVGRPAVLVGNSQGAVLAGRIAEHRPDLLVGLVLYAAPNPRRYQRVGAEIICQPAFMAWYPRFFWRRLWVGFGFNHGETAARGFLSRVGSDVFRHWARGIGRMIVELSRPDNWPTGEAISCPAAVLVGEQDILCPINAHHWTSRIPGAQQWVVPRASHLIGRRALPSCITALRAVLISAVREGLHPMREVSHAG